MNCEIFMRIEFCLLMGDACEAHEWNVMLSLATNCYLNCKLMKF